MRISNSLDKVKIAVSIFILLISSACRAKFSEPTATPLPKPSISVQPNISVQPAAVCTNQNHSPEVLFSESKAGVVKVITGNAIGSGFVVRHQNSNTYILTNAHVVEDTYSVKLKWIDGSEDSAAVVSNAGGESDLNDLALLEVKGIRGKVLNLKNTDLDVGAEVIAIGAPKGLDFSLTRGVLSGLREEGSILQIDAPVNSGNSGGPLIDRTGCVAGVITYKMIDTEGLNFAISASRITEFLNNLNSMNLLAKNKPIKPIIVSKSNCWFQMKEGDKQLKAFTCQVNSRVNANNHIVHDIIQSDGVKRTVVLWSNNTETNTIKAEVIANGNVYTGTYIKDNDKDILVSVEGVGPWGFFGFSPPR